MYIYHNNFGHHMNQTLNIETNTPSEAIDPQGALSPPGQNGRHFLGDIFQMNFREWKVLYFDLKFHWSLFLRVQLTTQHWFR